MSKSNRFVELNFRGEPAYFNISHISAVVAPEEGGGASVYIAGDDEPFRVDDDMDTVMYAISLLDDQS